MSHKVEHATQQTWGDGEPLPSDLARLMVLCSEGPSRPMRQLACWDGDAFSGRCGACGEWFNDREPLEPVFDVDAWDHLGMVL